MKRLEKFENWCEFALKGFTSYDFAIVLISYVLMALFNDLNLVTARNVCGSIFLMIVVWYFLTMVCLILLACIKKARSKKTNIEKLIDEESKKD